MKFFKVSLPIYLNGTIIATTTNILHNSLTEKEKRIYGSK